MPFIFRTSATFIADFKKRVKKSIRGQLAKIFRLNRFIIYLFKHIFIEFNYKVKNLYFI